MKLAGQASTQIVVHQVQSLWTTARLFICTLLASARDVLHTCGLHKLETCYALTGYVIPVPGKVARVVLLRAAPQEAEATRWEAGVRFELYAPHHETGKHTSVS